MECRKRGPKPRQVATRFASRTRWRIACSALLVGRVHRHVGEEREVVARAEAAEVGLQVAPRASGRPPPSSGPRRSARRRRASRPRPRRTAPPAGRLPVFSYSAVSARVAILLASTSGWLKGLMPQDRRPRSRSRSPSGRTPRPGRTWWPRGCARPAGPPPRGRRPPRPAPASGAVVEAQVGEERDRRRRPRARPTRSRSTGMMPLPSLPVDSAMSCSSQAPRSWMPGEATIVSLSMPRFAATPEDRAEHEARVLRRGHARARRPGSMRSASSSRRSTSRPMTAAGTMPKLESAE